MNKAGQIECLSKLYYMIQTANIDVANPIRYLTALNDVIDAIRKEDADDCEGCKFVGAKPWRLPCEACKRQAIDYWRGDKK